MKKIVLIGMPGAGKSTIGVLLAKSMLMDFTDTDLLIQREFSKSLCDIINEKGIEEFLKIENDVICGSSFENAVVATGGSAVFGESAMAKLKEDSAVIYLKTSPEVLEKRIDNIHTRGIAMEKGTTISELYIQRAPLYEKYADITVECTDLTAEECVDRITKKLREY
ncbi:MAG: shikimate kinase [Ruminococcaceae bacterium]|nr:shikimate kinase [Oscillospiraceae bacterium]